jgi:CheY-like chemotaxis protein/anti-sigma regulatory factor (Ser/Thr protein kinase)
MLHGMESPVQRYLRVKGRASLPTTIQIRKEIDSSVGNTLGDPVQIHQVLMNLCTNAHHAMRGMGGVLDVKVASVNLGSEYTSVHPDLKPGPYIKVTVKDTGHGMDEATIAKIFDPYFTTKEKGVGTGLGLAVVHGIVKKHRGAITVGSVPGKGSVFDLYLPAIQKDTISEAGIQEEMPTGHECILLVDDEQVLVDMGREMLGYLGYSVETRTSSVDALALFRANPDRFDMVITDMTMPNMTGDKLAVELMGIRADIPVVLCTGYSEKMLEERAKAIGIRSVLMKPLLMAKMATAIREALSNRPE